MYPVLFTIGPITFYSYGTILALSFAVGIYLAYRRAKTTDIPSKIIIDMGVYLLVAAIVGARICYVLNNLDWYVRHPLEIVFSRTGFVFYGGFILSICVGILYLKRHNISVLKMCDIIIPSVAIGEAIGRIGCFLNGCCYGRPTTLPWGIYFPDNTLPVQIFGNTAIHPTQLYLSIGNIIIFFILNSIKPKFDGEIFGIYLILHTLLRFTIEYIRGDATQIFLGLTVSQMISVILGVIGIVLLITKWQNYKHSHKEIPVSTK